MQPMITRIILENYMSHARTVIEPADGLTVLIGPNNCGKSAVVSALQTLCYNTSGDFMVRHGANQCSVTVELEDAGQAHTVTWRRKKGTVSYVIDGREIHRLLRDVPQDLHEILRMARVRTPQDATGFDIHFGEQKSPIFLLDESAGRQATFFASSSDAQKLLEMQRRHREQVATAKSDAKRMAAEIESLDKTLALLAPAPELCAAGAALENEYATVAAAIQKSADLQTLLARQDQAEHKSNLYKSRVTTIEPLRPLPELADVPSLEKIIRNLAEIARRQGQAAHAKESLANLTGVPVLADTSHIAEMISRTLRATADIQQRRMALANAEADLARARREIQDWAAANPTCPVCGGIVDAEHLLRYGHSEAAHA
jgi:exonuclease SbcC